MPRRHTRTIALPRSLLLAAVCALAGCNSLLGLDSVAPPPDGFPDGPVDGSPDAAATPPPPAITSPGDGTTTANLKPNVEGTCLTGATVMVANLGGTTWCEAACDAGAFACAPSLEQAEGQHEIVATQQNEGGISAASPTVVFTINTQAAIITSPANNAHVATATPAVSGTCITASTVTIDRLDDDGNPGQQVCQAPCIAGAFSCNAAPLPQGSYQLQATQSDPLATTVITITVDTVAPVAPTFSSPTPLQNAYVTTLQPTLGVACETAAQVSIYKIGGGLVAQGPCNNNTFLATAGALTEGSNSIYAVQTDLAGNSSPNSATRTFIIDTLAPAAPSIGSPMTNERVCDRTPTISGACESGATVTVYSYINSVYTQLCTSACLGSAFSCAPALGNEVALGVLPLRARQVDAAGHAGPYSTPSVSPIIFGIYDDDSDSTPDACDNCPHLANNQIQNSDGDGLGDACDYDPAHAQSIVAYYPGLTVSEFTSDGWIASGITANGDIRPQSNTGTLYKVYATATVGDVRVGGYEVSGVDDKALATSLSSNQSTVASCDIHKESNGAFTLAYLRNANEVATTSATDAGELRQAINWSTQQDICYQDGNGIISDDPSQAGKNVTTVQIDLDDFNVTISHVLLIKND